MSSVKGFSLNERGSARFPVCIHQRLLLLRRVSPLTVARMSVLKNLSVTSCVFMTIFVLSIVSAQNDLELSDQSNLESMEEIEELLRNVQAVFETKMASMVEQRTVEEEEVDDENDVHVEKKGCSCEGLKCSCCKNIRVRKLKLKGNCCLSVMYLPPNQTILISVTLKSRTLFSKSISVRAPKRLCVGVPYLKKGGSVCLQFYNLNVTEKSLSGCARISVRLLKKCIAKIKLGCFRMSFLEATQEVGSVDLPYLDGQQAPVEGPETLYLGEVTMEKEPIYLGEVPMQKIKPSEYKKN